MSIDEFRSHSTGNSQEKTIFSGEEQKNDESVELKSLIARFCEIAPILGYPVRDSSLVEQVFDVKTINVPNEIEFAVSRRADVDSNFLRCVFSSVRRFISDCEMCLQYEVLFDSIYKSVIFRNVTVTNLNEVSKEVATLFTTMQLAAKLRAKAFSDKVPLIAIESFAVCLRQLGPKYLMREVSHVVSKDISKLTEKDNNCHKTVVIAKNK